MKACSYYNSKLFEAEFDGWGCYIVQVTNPE